MVTALMTATATQRQIDAAKDEVIEALKDCILLGTVDNAATEQVRWDRIACALMGVTPIAKRLAGRGTVMPPRPEAFVAPTLEDAIPWFMQSMAVGD